MIKELRESMRHHVARYTDHVNVVALHHKTTVRLNTPVHLIETSATGTISRAVRTRRVYEHDGFMV